MELFDNVEYERFFNPLCCRNKRIYYECILELIEKSKTVPLLYELDARDTIVLYLRNCAYAVEEEAASNDTDENISSKKSEVENAGAILRYFRHCRWISEKELGRNGDNIATITPYCRKTIETIERIFNRDSSATLSNHIFAIYDILHSAFITDHGRTHRPYSNILVPIVDGVWDLKSELLVLKDSIRAIMRVIIKMTETNEMGQFLIKDEMMESFFNDYFFIKKGGLIPGYIQEIEKMLRQITNTEVYENMSKEYQSFNNVDEREAKEIVDGMLTEVKSFISYNYVKEMDYIDKKINNYYNLYSTRIFMVLSNNVNMQTYLNDLLMYLKDFEAEERSEILSYISKCFILQVYKYVGRKSIERRKKRKPNTKSGAIITSSLSDEEKARLTRELLYEYPDRYGVKQAAEYFDYVLKEKESVIPDRTMVKSREDAMMVAASIIYSGSGKFPYEVEFLPGMIDTGIAMISNVKIKRKQ
ncbi:MAG: Wadjet anti-phage system protein JetA family protein [Anaerostipes sp.]